jgi:hypothetical protein
LIIYVTILTQYTTGKLTGISHLRYLPRGFNVCVLFMKQVHISINLMRNPTNIYLLGNLVENGTSIITLWRKEYLRVWMWYLRNIILLYTLKCIVQYSCITSLRNIILEVVVTLLSNWISWEGEHKGSNNSTINTRVSNGIMAFSPNPTSNTHLDPSIDQNIPPPNRQTHKVYTRKPHHVNVEQMHIQNQYQLPTLCRWNSHITSLRQLRVTLRYCTFL